MSKRIALYLTSCILLQSLSISCFAQQAIIVKQQQILQNPPFKACHASTICETADGSMLAAWFGGEYESHKEVSIWTARFSNGKWSSPVMCADGKDSIAGIQYACWNPVLHRSSEGKLFLYYKVGPSPREWWGMMKTSTDNGTTWSRATRLPSGMLGPIKNKPISISTGELLHPSSEESPDEKKWTIHFEKTNAMSEGWTKIPVASDTFGVIQPSILKWPGRRLQMLARSRQNAIVQAWSEDEGATWGPLTKSSLVNPNSGIDAVTTKDGLQVLVYNPVVKGNQWFNGRNKLNVAISNDGQTWKDILKLEDKQQGEFSYPAIIQSSDGMLHVTYTDDRKNITHVMIRLQ